MTRKHLALLWLAIGALVTGCAVQGRGQPATSASASGSVYNIRTAGAEAQHLLGLVRLPPDVRRSVRQPAGSGTALSSYSVNVPVVPNLADRHEFFTASGTPASVIGWTERHRPAGSRQDDSGDGSTAGARWTSFSFPSIKGFATSPDLVVDAVPLHAGGVAIRVDAQVAPRPKLPGNGRGPGAVRVVEAGLQLGAFGYELRCDPAGGNIPDPARICAAIVGQPALLYSFPGPGHSCPFGAGSVSIVGTWNDKPLRSSFSVCTGGQEGRAIQWADLLPSIKTLGTVNADRGIGPVSLGESEESVVDLLRAAQPAPRLCTACTRTFSAGYSVGYDAGPAQRAGWTVSFAGSRVTRIETNVQLTVGSFYVTSGLAHLHHQLRGWQLQTCGSDSALVHSSATGRTLVLYHGTTFQRVIVTTARSGS